MKGFILRAAISALGLWVASLLFDGLHFESTVKLAIAALLLGIVNAFVRPLAFILTLPITVVTLGLFLLVLNAGMVGTRRMDRPGLYDLRLLDSGRRRTHREHRVVGGVQRNRVVGSRRNHSWQHARLMKRRTQESMCGTVSGAGLTGRDDSGESRRQRDQRDAAEDDQRAHDLHRAQRSRPGPASPAAWQWPDSRRRTSRHDPCAHS